MTQIIENDDCGHLCPVPELGEDEHGRTAQQEQRNAKQHLIGIGYDGIAKSPYSLDRQHQFIENRSDCETNQP